MKRYSAALLVLFVSVPLLLHTGFLWKKDKVSASKEKAGEALYQCSMHPAIVSSKPEDCPICGMRLNRIHRPIKMTSTETPGAPIEEKVVTDFDAKVSGYVPITITPERRQLIGLRTNEVRERPLIQTLRVLGNVGYDPDLYETYSEYVEALQAYWNVRTSPIESVRRRAEDLLEVTKTKMRLTGLGDEQIERIVRYAQPTRTFVLRETADWIYADVYEQDAYLIAPEEKVRITASAYPGKVFHGKIKTADAVLNQKSRTLRIRVEVENPERYLKPGMAVDLEVEAPFGKKLVVPHEAVFDSGERQMVFVDEGEGRLSPRRVQLGDQGDQGYEVLAGLKAGEKVVTSANFLIDSESRVQAAAENFNPHAHHA